MDHPAAQPSPPLASHPHRTRGRRVGWRAAVVRVLAPVLGAALLAACSVRPSAPDAWPAPTQMPMADASSPDGPALPDADLGGPSLPTSDGPPIVIEDLPDAAPAACAGCPPGHTCRDGACTADCRDTRSVPCQAPLACDYLSGQCRQGGNECQLAGAPQACGRGGPVTGCGPGARCGGDGMTCQPDVGCTAVVCDATGFCRGTGCPQQGGGVRSILVEEVPDADAGARGGIRARARVDAALPCGLAVTFELRRDAELYVSAAGDQSIWRVPFQGAAQRYLRTTTAINGLAADRHGNLYYATSDVGNIFRVRGDSSPPTPERFSSGEASLSRITFGPDGQLYGVARGAVLRFGETGQITGRWTLPVATSLSGLTFDRVGALVVGELWPWTWRQVPGAPDFVRLADASRMVPSGTQQPYNEGVALGPDGLIYVGVFPTTNNAGVIYRIDTLGTPRRWIGLSEIKRDVPQTQYAGIHGLAFGVDGTLYFVNQNTATLTREPRGQVLALRPSGRIELVAGGLNVDWGRGFDGDIVVAQQTLTSDSVSLDTGGHATAALDAPAGAGTYGLRVLITDPKSGAIAEHRTAVRVR